MEFLIPTQGHPLADDPSGARPISMSLNDPHGMMNQENLDPIAIWDKINDMRQENIINDAIKRYPACADENMILFLDNNAVGSVNIRVFMTIRARYLEKIKSLMLEHKDAMMKKEAEWLTKMENEKIELGKQISIRDQMVLEARAETNEYKSMNQSILSQISDKEAKIAQVSFSGEVMARFKAKSVN